jgi:hypothetical protein
LAAEKQANDQDNADGDKCDRLPPMLQSSDPASGLSKANKPPTTDMIPPISHQNEPFMSPSHVDAPEIACCCNPLPADHLPHAGHTSIGA